ncbi:MAG: leucine-rich repeat domain-containing protein [Thermoanaerobaculia bacterium]
MPVRSAVIGTTCTRTPRSLSAQLSGKKEEIGNLAGLRELHLRNAALRTLPRAIGRLRELRQLDLRGNPLDGLPDSLLDLPRLEKLDLRWVPGRFDVADRLEQRGCLVYR